jgi:hypothetical protein
MLPKSTVTPRLAELQQKLLKVTGKEIGGWPQVTRDDIVLVGCVIVLYSYIDMDLRRIVEAAENGGVLQAPYKGKIARMPISEAEKAVMSLPDWSPPNMVALNRIQEMRGLRNLFAHFAIRRFPNDDAFVLVTKSIADYKREFGSEPTAGEAMTAIIEVGQVKETIKEIQRVHTWLATATTKIELMFDNRASGKTNP